MFLDLSSSTTIAELLGHLKFSYLLQDCFKDLSSCLLENNASIYQFVGDEAVITWEISKKTDRQKCFNLFYSFQKPYRIRKIIM